MRTDTPYNVRPLWHLHWDTRWATGESAHGAYGSMVHIGSWGVVPIPIETYEGRSSFRLSQSVSCMGSASNMNLRLGEVRSAFTLVEVLIVVVILGILAAIVVPQFSDAAQDSTAAALMNTLDTVKSCIDWHYHADGTGSYPDEIAPEWFASNMLPRHPENSFGVVSIQVDDTPDRLHPASKVLKTGVGGAFWYNPTEGIIRSRVADQGSAISTLSFYNRVNRSNETGLGNYGGGGGS